MKLEENMSAEEIDKRNLVAQFLRDDGIEAKWLRPITLFWLEKWMTQELYDDIVKSRKEAPPRIYAKVNHNMNLCFEYDQKREYQHEQERKKKREKKKCWRGVGVIAGFTALLNKVIDKVVDC